MNKKNCKCGTEMNLTQITKIIRNHKISYNILSMEEIKATEVIETYFECPKCNTISRVNGKENNFFAIKEKP